MNAIMGGSAQPLIWLIRTGLGHVSYKTHDYASFNTVLIAEGHNFENAHMFGAIQVFGPDEPAVQEARNLVRRMGFKRMLWERIHNVTKEQRNVDIEFETVVVELEPDPNEPEVAGWQ